MKIRTVEELQEKLDEDFAWRRKELTALSSTIKLSKPNFLFTNIRIGVVMLYAHWEGFIKNAAEYYLSYISSKGLMLKEVTSNIIAISVKAKIEELEVSNKHTLHSQVVDYLLSDLNDKVQIPSENVIKTQSNLNFSILREILSVIGVDFSLYELKENYIDSQLLKNRNSVAHGQNPAMNEVEYEKLYFEITSMMNSIKNEISNNASQTKFKRQIILQP